MCFEYMCMCVQYSKFTLGCTAVFPFLSLSNEYKEKKKCMAQLTTEREKERERS